MSKSIINPTISQNPSIVCQTRCGNDIKNFQIIGPLINYELQQADVYKKQHCLAKYRTNPCGYYNCHGMIFASRRTIIGDPDEIKKILVEDNYKQVNESAVLPGDIALYYEDGDLLHSGVVVEVSDDSMLVQRIKLVGKWGLYHEVVHWLGDCPYSQHADKIMFYRVESESLGAI